MLIIPFIVVRFFTYIGIIRDDHGIIYFVGVREVPAGTTLHLPFTHPHRPAPQSMGPWQTSVQSRVQTPLFALLMQLVGWQHSAGTQSSALVQACASGGVVTMPGTVVK
jgi:hypothetical protein